MGKIDTDKISLVSQVIMFVGLLALLPLGLLPALLAGLLVYNIVVFGALRLGCLGVLPRMARATLLTLISLVVGALFVLGGMKFFSFINGDSESIVGVIQQMAIAVNSAQKSMPDWAQTYIPSDMDDWQRRFHAWLMTNAKTLSLFGRDAGMFLVHIVFGIIIGGMAALCVTTVDSKAPLTRAFEERTSYLNLAFRRIVFSQIRISALNTFLTGLFLAVFMPLVGYHLPLVKTMILVTFVVGLMPIIGNIISNTMIFLIALGVAPGAALAALIFLIVIHKLEYFVNAKIIGTRINAHAWELLISMLIMDAAFGTGGLVAAPIYYAYLKDELTGKKLI
ncbi:MAG: hypothetical protein PHS57_09010 [Alphaproteobacteria bacterium]|nr:hypothetical protein [Alphaproteobacteria bacterium]